MNVIDHLKTISSKFPGNKRKEMAGPGLIHDGEMHVWVFASDARMIAFYPATLPIWLPSEPGIFYYDQLHFVESPQEHQDLVSILCPEKALAYLQTSAGSMRRFCSPLGVQVSWTQPCPACKGTSKESDCVICTFCDGDGVMGADDSPGYVLDLPIDCTRLSQLLDVDVIEDEDVLIFRVVDSPIDSPIESKQEMRFLHVMAPNASLAMMQMLPVKGCEEKWENAPHFESEAKEK